MTPKIYSLENSELKVENAEIIVKNINKVIMYFKNKDLPIIYIRHMHNSNGSDAGRMFDFTGEIEEIGFNKGSVEVEYVDELIKY